MLLFTSLFQLAFVATIAAQSTPDVTWVPFDRSQFSNNTALDTDGSVQLFWRTGDEYSTYGVASRSNGYLGLGFSQTGAMTGADMAIGYRHTNGTFIFENRHATDFVQPQVSPDQSTDMRFKEGGQADGVTYFVFDKKNTADCFDTQADVMTDSWQWFIYAHSDSNTFEQHQNGNMGKQYVKLGTGKDVSVNRAFTVDNAKNFTVTQPEVTIPNQETTYCYSLHKMPAGKKNFLIGERPHLSSDLLHHQVLYACYDLPNSYLDMIGKEPNCDYLNFSNPCNGFVTEWAPGMAARTFEPGYGKPFGEDLYEYAMLEVHYNNPELLEGVRDEASYTFLWTDEQVETEIGTLTLGDIQVEGWSLEPGKELVSHSTVCTPNCTSNWPSEGITAVAVFHHMHARGVNTQVQIIRDGKEITPLSSLRDFEYGYQFSKSLNEVKLLPGDRLITTCQYNTINDTKPVPGGLSSQAEMCFAWVDYYPANDVLICSQFDLGNSPMNPYNGSVGACMTTSGDPDIYEPASLTADYEHLPVMGSNCTEGGGGTTVGASVVQTCTESDVCFSLNVPESSANSEGEAIFFQLTAPTTYSWVALGQGTAMSNAHMFVMYSSADGNNVTLSPRTTSGHVMPTHNTAATFTLLEGSGISNGKMTANVRCSNCKDTMSLGGGEQRRQNEDTTSENSDWVYAHHSGPPLASDDLNAPITQHDSHGAFTWDLSQATGGSAANPFLNMNPATTTPSSSASDRNTRLVRIHGALAALAFVAVFPIGGILVRFAKLSNLAWIHGTLQVFGYAIFLAAGGIGIHLADDLSYLSEAHVIIGVVLLVVLFFMPMAGVLHHRMYKKVHKRTMLSYGHVWTGRVAIILGMINGGAGLQLADAETSRRIVYGVFAGLMGAVYIGAVVFGRMKRRGHKKEDNVVMERDKAGRGSNSE
jgi:hypothetical protein